MKTRSLPILAIAVAGLSLAGCLPKADFKVSMRLLDEETGKPIPDALVFVEARAQADPPREAPYNQAVVTAWGKTDSSGVARIAKVQGFHWGAEPQDKLWKMLESRKPQVKRMIASIEGGSILVFAKDYGALHHPFGIMDNPQFQKRFKKGGYTGLAGKCGFKGEDSMIELSNKDLREGKELVLKMRKPESPEYLAASLSVYGLSTIWPATSRKTGMTQKQQEQVYRYFVDSVLPVMEASDSPVVKKNVEGLQSPETRKWFVSPYHGLGKTMNHDTVIHAWLTQKSLELLPPGYEEAKRYVLAIKEGVRDEDELARSIHHFYNPNDPSFGVMGGEPSLKWGAIGYPDNPNNEWDFTDAVRYYQAGDKEKAYKALGHVMHLLADLSAPLHTHAIRHEYTLMPESARFETFFSQMAKKNGDSLPPEYSQAAKEPKRIADLKEAFESTAKLTFGAFNQDGIQVDFGDYFAWKTGEYGEVTKNPDDKALELMGKYLFPQAIESGAGLVMRFHDALHLTNYAQKPTPKDTDAPGAAAQPTGDGQQEKPAQKSAGRQDSMRDKMLIAHGRNSNGRRLLIYQEGSQFSLRIEDSTGKEIRTWNPSNGYIAVSPNGYFSLLVKSRKQDRRVVSDLELVDISGKTVWEKSAVRAGGGYSVSDAGNVVGLWASTLFRPDGSQFPLDRDLSYVDANYLWSPSGNAFMVASTTGVVRCILDNGKTAYTHNFATSDFQDFGGIAVLDDCGGIFAVRMKSDKETSDRVVSLSASGAVLKEIRAPSRLTGPAILPISKDGRFFAYCTKDAVHVVDNKTFAQSYSYALGDLAAEEIALPKSDRDLVILGTTRGDSSFTVVDGETPISLYKQARLRILQRGRPSRPDMVIQRPRFNRRMNREISIDVNSNRVTVLSADAPKEITLDEK